MSDADDRRAMREVAQRRLEEAGIVAGGAWVPPEQRPARVPTNVEEIVPRVRQAWIAVGVFAAMAVYAVVHGYSVRAQHRTPSEFTEGVLVGTAALGAVAVVLSGRPLKCATKFGANFMIPRVYMPGFMGLLPLFAPYALVEAVIRLASSTVGGYATAPSQVGPPGAIDGPGGISPAGFGRSGRSTYYPRVALALGEGRPLGVTLLLLATLWPAAFALALVGK